MNKIRVNQRYCKLCGEKLSMFNKTDFCNSVCEKWYNLKMEGETKND